MRSTMGTPPRAATEVPDEELVRHVRKGDAASLGALLSRYYAGMFAVALGMLRDPVDAEDAVQDAMLAALRRLADDLRDPASAGAWLRAVVRNECRMRLRSPGPVPAERIDELPDASPGADPFHALDQVATRDWVWHAVQRLSPSLQVDRGRVRHMRLYHPASRRADVPRGGTSPYGSQGERCRTGS